MVEAAAVVLVAIIAVGGFWLWVILTLVRDAALRRPIDQPALLALAFAVASALFGFYLYHAADPLWGLYYGMLPPLALWHVSYIPAEGFVWWIVPGAALAAGLAVVACYSFRRPVLAPGPAVIVATVAALAIGEPLSRFFMCRAARAEDVGTIYRQPLSLSMRRLGQDHRIKAHGAFRHDGRIWGWSYREMAFVPFPPGNNVRLPDALDCGR